VAAVPSGLSLTPLRKKKNCIFNPRSSTHKRRENIEAETRKRGKKSKRRRGSRIIAENMKEDDKKTRSSGKN
jgi:hypothetical protein